MGTEKHNELRKLLDNYYSQRESLESIITDLEAVYERATGERYTNVEVNDSTKKVSKSDLRVQISSMTAKDKIVYAVRTLGMASSKEVLEHLQKIDSTTKEATIKTIIYKLQNHELLLNDGKFSINPNFK